MKKIKAIFLFLAFTLSAYSEDIVIDENAMFGDETQPIVVQKEEKSEKVDAELNIKKIGISGEIEFRGKSKSKAPWIDGKNYTTFESATKADLYLDARIQDGFKVYADIEGSYYPNRTGSSLTVEGTDGNGNIQEFTYTQSNSEIILKEFFFDANYKRKVYFRFGKQNLKWGKSYFWNPTDTINIERKSFMDLDRVREGVYGVKAHIPFGAEKNIYIFINNEDAGSMADSGISAKYEFLVKNTEMSFSLWSKKNRKPIIGYDISGRALDMDLRLEASASYGSDGEKFVEIREGEDSSGNPILYPFYNKYEDKVIPKITAGFTKSFDYGDFKDRISLNGEFYYNGKGYNENIIKKFTNSDDRTDYFKNYYEPNEYGRYYIALFTQFDKFLNDSNKSIKLNAISNLSDMSGIVTAGFVYNPIDDFTVETDLNGYFGSENSEYMLVGDRVSAEAILSLKF